VNTTRLVAMLLLCNKVEQ